MMSLFGCCPPEEGNISLLRADGTMICTVAPGARKGKRPREWQEMRLVAAQAKGSATIVYGATFGSVQETGRRWGHCAREAGWGLNSHIQAMGDGAEWIRLQSQEIFGNQVTFLCDFFHVSEYLEQQRRSVDRPNRTTGDTLKRSDSNAVPSRKSLRIWNPAWSRRRHRKKKRLSEMPIAISRTEKIAWIIPGHQVGAADRLWNDRERTPPRPASQIEKGGCSMAARPCRSDGPPASPQGQPPLGVILELASPTFNHTRPVHPTRPGIAESRASVKVQDSWQRQISRKAGKRNQMAPA